MKIFVDIGHPAHVHYFKNTIIILSDDGHQFCITARDKDVTHQLLKKYHISFINRGRGRNSLIGKLFYLLKTNLRLYKIAKTFRPDLFLSFASPYAAQVSRMLKIPHITFTDTEHAMLGNTAFLPFSDVVITPLVFLNDLGKNHIRFDGFMELCYLQERYFKPDDNVLGQFNLSKNDKFVIIRLVSWNASHDIGQTGFYKDSIVKLVETLKKYAKVCITSEGTISKELEKYKLNIHPTDIHHFLAHAALFIGEGATMASECAMLGTPAIYVNTLSAGTLQDQEKNGLLYSYRNPKRVIEKAEEILKDRNAKQKQINCSKNYLKNKINVTEFMNWFITNYPHSKIKLKKDPEYENIFRNNLD